MDYWWLNPVATEALRASQCPHVRVCGGVGQLAGLSPAGAKYNHIPVPQSSKFPGPCVLEGEEEGGGLGKHTRKGAFFDHDYGSVCDVVV